MNIFLERASGFYLFEPSGKKGVSDTSESGFEGKKPGGRGFEKGSEICLFSKVPSGPLSNLAYWGE